MGVMQCGNPTYGKSLVFERSFSIVIRYTKELIYSCQICFCSFECLCMHNKNNNKNQKPLSIVCFMEHNKGLTTHSHYIMWHLEKRSLKINIVAFTVDLKFSNNKQQNQCFMTAVFALYNWTSWMIKFMLTFHNEAAWKL